MAAGHFLYRLALNVVVTTTHHLLSVVPQKVLDPDRCHVRMYLINCAKLINIVSIVVFYYSVFELPTLKMCNQLESAEVLSMLNTQLLKGSVRPLPGNQRRKAPKYPNNCPKFEI